MLWIAFISVPASADRLLCISVAHDKILAIAASRRNRTVKMTVYLSSLSLSCSRVHGVVALWSHRDLLPSSPGAFLLSLEVFRLDIEILSGNSAMQIYGTLQWAWMPDVMNTSLCDLAWYLLEDFGVYLLFLYLLLVSEQDGERAGECAVVLRVHMRQLRRGAEC